MYVFLSSIDHRRAWVSVHEASLDLDFWQGWDDEWSRPPQHGGLRRVLPPVRFLKDILGRDVCSRFNVSGICIIDIFLTYILRQRRWATSYHFTASAQTLFKCTGLFLLLIVLSFTTSCVVFVLGRSAALTVLIAAIFVPPRSPLQLKITQKLQFFNICYTVNLPPTSSLSSSHTDVKLT